MDLFPAIDLRGGRCVRLYQGDYERETVYGDDPVAQAKLFESEGATWIHVVDLDAARTGEPINRDVVAAIAHAVDVPIQTGGGVRSEESARALFNAGVERVVIGTAALEQPDLVRRLAAEFRIAVGLDSRGREVAVRGWEERSGRDVVEVASEFADAGVDAVIVTEIGRDGTLEGPDVDGLTLMLRSTSMDVVASGGVSSINDLKVLEALESDGRRLAGAIIGRAIYEGRFTVSDALRAISRT